MKKQVCAYLLLSLVYSNAHCMLEPIPDSEARKLLREQISSIRYQSVERSDLPLKIAVVVDEPIEQELYQQENKRKCRDKAICCALTSLCSCTTILAIGILALIAKIRS